MTSYDRQYTAEEELFGQPYPEFDAFLQQHARGGDALDLGCGQGRDALLLARHGYRVSGVDTSQVGIDQMVARAAASDLPVTGVVDDLFTFALTSSYDAIVLDSILHFQPSDREKELDLLNRLFAHLRPGGYLFIFVHKSPAKEKQLRTWFDDHARNLRVAHEEYIDYVYEEKNSGFRSESQMFALFLQYEAAA